MAYPVDSLSDSSSRQDIQAAIVATVQQMVGEGMDQATAQQQAMQMAMTKTGGGSTKLSQSHSIGALKDGGLSGTAPASGGGGYVR